MSFGEDDACPISVWQQNFQVVEPQPSLRSNHASQALVWRSLLMIEIQISFLIIAVAFLWQNMSGID